MDNAITINDLLVRKQLYLKGLAAGKTKRQALLDAGYARTTVSAHVETPDVKAAFAKLMRRRVPAHKIAQRLAEGLDAQETKFFHKDGLVTETREVVNWGERRAYAELVSKMGEYFSERTEHTGKDGGPIVFGLERL